MSDLRKMARDAGFNTEFDDYVIDHWQRFEKFARLINAAALAQPEQEPVAWNWVFDGKDYGPAYYGKPPDADITKQAEQRGRTVRLLYTAPPQRKPLTLQEVDVIWATKTDIESVVRAVERAHGIE